MTRSLRQLSVATRAVADGSFSAPIAVRGHDEVGDLARSFNTMAQQFRQVDEMKEEFFATISHDLKSPLGSISEAAYLLREGVTGSLSPRQARLVGIIGASADRILGLVNRLLDLSRLRSGVLPLKSRPVNLASWWSASWRSFGPRRRPRASSWGPSAAGGTSSSRGTRSGWPRSSSI